MTTKQRQNLLQYLGFYEGAVDGIYGTLTKQAVEGFQTAYGIGVDGVAGQETDKALRHAVAYGMPEDGEPDEGQAGKQTSDPVTANDASKFLKSDGCYHIPKVINVQLSKNLWSSEIECQGIGCCAESIISKRMVDLFQAIRDAYGDSIEIVTAGGSGYRCNTHNAEVGGAYASLHMTGNALDLHCSDKAKLLSIVTKLVTDGEIGVYSWGIHVGVWNRGYVNRFTYG